MNKDTLGSLAVLSGAMIFFVAVIALRLLNVQLSWRIVVVLVPLCFGIIPMLVQKVQQRSRVDH